jgi:hypothetical protein
MATARLSSVLGTIRSGLRSASFETTHQGMMVWQSVEVFASNHALERGVSRLPGEQDCVRLGNQREETVALLLIVDDGLLFGM